MKLQTYVVLCITDIFLTRELMRYIADPALMMFIGCGRTLCTAAKTYKILYKFSTAELFAAKLCCEDM